MLGTIALTRLGRRYLTNVALKMALSSPAVVVHAPEIWSYVFKFFTRRIYLPCVKIADLCFFTGFFKLFNSLIDNEIMQSWKLMHIYYSIPKKFDIYYILSLSLWPTFGCANSIVLLTQTKF